MAFTPSVDIGQRVELDEGTHLSFPTPVFTPNSVDAGRPNELGTTFIATGIAIFSNGLDVDKKSTIVLSTSFISQAAAIFSNGEPGSVIATNLFPTSISFLCFFTKS